MSAGVLAAVSTSTDPSIGSSLVHMVLALAAVIGAILVVNKILRALRGGARPRAAGHTGGLEILARQSLGKGVMVAVVRFGGREVLVGVTGQHITFVEEGGSARLDPATAIPETTVAAIAPRVATTEAPAPVRDASLDELEAMLRRSSISPSRAFGTPQTATSLLERLRTVTERR